VVAAPSITRATPSAETRALIARRLISGHGPLAFIYLPWPAFDFKVKLGAMKFAALRRMGGSGYPI